MKRILFLSTGGTIASSQSAQGIVPRYDAGALLEAFPSLKNRCSIEAKSIMNIDSTNMQPEDWIAIAEQTFAGLERSDGVVISHGTHTLAYTAAALSFMLQNLLKPVILTGSQLTLFQEGSDAGRNLIDAFTAALSDLSGVFVVFNRKIILGTRASKVKSKSLNAFFSINYPYVGRVFNDRVEHFLRKPPPAEGNPRLIAKVSPLVFLLKLIPGTPPGIFDALISLGFRGVIIQGYGIGSVPTAGKDLSSRIQEMLDRGIHVIVGTQSLYDGTDLGIYATSREALRKGVIEGHDMTTEALVAKLMWALGQTDDPTEVRRIMSTNYADEMTP
jgi:L-asparaginase